MDLSITKSNSLARLVSFSLFSTIFRRACVNAQSLRHEGLYFFFLLRLFPPLFVQETWKKYISTHEDKASKKKKEGSANVCLCVCVLLEHIRLGKVLWRWFRESGVWRVCVCVWLAVCVRHDHPSHASGRPQRLNCVARFNNGALSVLSPCCLKKTSPIPHMFF